MKITFKPQVATQVGYPITKCANIKKANVDVNNLRPSGFSRVLTFTGNEAKNFGQIASIAPEYQGLLNSIYKIGGLGNVAGEAAVAFHDHGGADIRTFVPYYAPDNKDGKIKVRTPQFNEDGTRVQWQTPNGEQPAFEFKAVDLNYQLRKDEEFVIHEPVIKGKEWTTGYKVIEPTGIFDEGHNGNRMHFGL